MFLWGEYWAISQKKTQMDFLFLSRFWRKNRLVGLYFYFHMKDVQKTNIHTHLSY